MVALNNRIEITDDRISELKKRTVDNENTNWGGDID